MKSMGGCTVFWVALLVGIEIVTAGPVEVHRKEASFTVNDLIGMSGGLDAVQEWCNKSSSLWLFCNTYSRAKTIEVKQMECWENANSLFRGNLNGKNLSDAKVSISQDVFAPLRRSFACNATAKGFFLTLTNDTVKDVVLFKYTKPGPTTTTTAIPITENTSSESTTPSDIMATGDGDEDNHRNWIIPLAIVGFVLAGLVIAFFIHQQGRVSSIRLLM